MPKQLNITNGDGAAELLRAAEIEGEVLPWWDLMFEGPFPDGLDLAATSQQRAAYFAENYPKEEDALATFCHRDEQLAAATSYDAITLWFEHDLLDQLQLLQILDWFATSGIGQGTLSLICIGDFPGIEPFRGLGQLRPDQIGTLKAEPVSSAQLKIAQSGWRAFRSPDPRAIEDFLHKDLTRLPFLGNTLLRHLEEFPALSNGLSRTDRQLLELVSQGVSEPGALFAENMARETVMYIGDWCTFRHIGELCDGSRPLLRCSPDRHFRFPPADDLPMAAFRAQTLTLTEDGEEVLTDTADAAALRYFDRWLGGVRLRPDRLLWRWNMKTLRLQRTAATKSPHGSSN